ncbi:MAG: hypothetical protein ACFFHD_04115 [Promethearchaeota archaeon]
MFKEPIRNIDPIIIQPILQELKNITSENKKNLSISVICPGLIKINSLLRLANKSTMQIANKNNLKVIRI